jgi:translation elongation factor EF-1alpha
MRMSISDTSKGPRANIVNVVGRLESGVLQVGEDVVSVPGGNRGTVRCKYWEETVMLISSFFV